MTTKKRGRYKRQGYIKKSIKLPLKITQQENADSREDKRDKNK